MKTTLHCEDCGRQVFPTLLSDGHTYWGHAAGDTSGTCSDHIVERRWSVVLTGERPREFTSFGSLAKPREGFRDPQEELTCGTCHGEGRIDLMAEWHGPPGVERHHWLPCPDCDTPARAF